MHNINILKAKTIIFLEVNARYILMALDMVIKNIFFLSEIESQYVSKAGI